jgi:hypothetical protein
MSAAEILEAIRAMSLAERREIVGEILAEI